ncbi:hypothetical protein BDA99DRAFT_103561 [Phascolomyces articulosus]|uniref:Uncharacterized protein n=1 Tax=Phascolomyces articulosus TaxID=60185 RepID=A0AAD5JX86_9FUNG|nr:hypothetical protein BDA99DRAFT_103561 [Phascolomyces articulosus]
MGIHFLCIVKSIKMVIIILLLLESLKSNLRYSIYIIYIYIYKGVTRKREKCMCYVCVCIELRVLWDDLNKDNTNYHNDNIHVVCKKTCFKQEEYKYRGRSVDGRTERKDVYGWGIYKYIKYYRKSNQIHYLKLIDDKRRSTAAVRMRSTNSASNKSFHD